MWALRVCAKFFERLQDLGGLGRMAWTRADVGETARLQDLADGALVVADPEAFLDELL